MSKTIYTHWINGEKKTQLMRTNIDSLIIKKKIKIKNEKIILIKLLYKIQDTFNVFFYVITLLFISAFLIFQKYFNYL